MATENKAQLDTYLKSKIKKLCGNDKSRLNAMLNQQDTEYGTNMVDSLDEKDEKELKYLIEEKNYLLMDVLEYLWNNRLNAIGYNISANARNLPLLSLHNKHMREKATVTAAEDIASVYNESSNTAMYNRQLQLVPTYRPPAIPMYSVPPACYPCHMTVPIPPPTAPMYVSVPQPFRAYRQPIWYELGPYYNREEGLPYNPRLVVGDLPNSEMEWNNELAALAIAEQELELKYSNSRVGTLEGILDTFKHIVGFR